MNFRVVITLWGLVGCVLSKPVTHNFTMLLCNSPEAEAAAQASLDFINAQHAHGYKYTLNQIEDIKVINKVDGTHMYLLELEFLETKCHVYNPKTVPQCDVRTKIETAVEADCDVALSEAGGNFSVVAFKCKTELESFGPCPGCPFLQPLNNTDGIQLVLESLGMFNQKQTHNATFALLDVGRLSSQVVSGGPLLKAEYVIIETNCSSVNNDSCVPLDHVVAHHGFCHSESHGLNMTVDCEIFSPDSAALPAPPNGPASPSTSHGFKHHKLTVLHDPDITGLLSAESESAEKAPVVKRAAEDPQPNGAIAAGPVVLHPRCPGIIKHF